MIELGRALGFAYGHDRIILFRPFRSKGLEIDSHHCLQYSRFPYMNFCGQSKVPMICVLVLIRLRTYSKQARNFFLKQN